MITLKVQRFKRFKSFIAVVRDPTRTDEIFKVITDPTILKPETFDVVLKKLGESPNCVELIEKRYSGSWDLDELLKLPNDSIGYIYAKHMRDNGLDINFYPPVPGESVEAYVQLRSRQTHDIWHILTGFDTSVPGEVGLQAFLQAQMHARSPSLIISMFTLHCCFFNPALLFETTNAISKGWAMGIAARPLFGEKFEECWEKNLQDYRRELNLR